jgi:hypothetical protein
VTCSAKPSWAPILKVCLSKCSTESLFDIVNLGNDTYACDSFNCQISCASPEFGSNVCYSMKQNFLDGTSCSGGGRCSNGQCQGATVGGQILSWIDSNKPLVIGLSAGIGGFLLIAVLSCIISCCRRRRRPKYVANQPPPGWTAPPPPRGRRYQGGNQWAGQQIPQPPPMRTRDRWGQNNAPPPVWQGSPTVRYA